MVGPELRMDVSKCAQHLEAERMSYAGNPCACGHGGRCKLCPTAAYLSASPGEQVTALGLPNTHTDEPLELCSPNPPCSPSEGLREGGKSDQV